MSDTGPMPATASAAAPASGPRLARGSQGGDGPARIARGPIDPRLVQRASATRWFLAAMVVVGCLTAVLTLGQAWYLSRAIAGVFYDRTLDSITLAVPALIAIFAAKAVLAGANNVLAQRAAASVKSQLRLDLMRARLDRPLDARTSTGGLVTLVTQGLDALDGFYSKYLPQLVLAVTVPLIVGLAILTRDLTSALIVALTLPLIPVFMALVGWTTEARTKRRWALQTRLARHFADLVAGLPTLQVFGRARAQAEGLRKTEASHRRETMGTLRISFLSALVLELLSTLSVAVVAVTIGFRVAFGDLDLGTSLFILILAPEVYLPVRAVGTHYHDSADGMAAAADAFALIDGPLVVADSPGADVPGADVAGADSPGADAAGAVAPGVPLGVASGAAPAPDAVPARASLSSPPLAALTPAAEAGPTPDHALNGVRSGSLQSRPGQSLDHRPGRTLDAGGERAGSAPTTAVGDHLSNREHTTSTPSTPTDHAPSDSGHTGSAPTTAAGNPHSDREHTTSTPSTPTDHSPSDSGHTGSADLLVAVSGVSHRYPGTHAPAVSGVSFAVAPGEFVVLTGPSGGGKTTVLNALIGFVRPTSGRVLAPERTRIAYVGQHPGMITGTIADNVRLGYPAASDALVADALARAGGADLDPGRSVGDDGEGLSAGERRRVATARALLRIDPGGADLLLLDEPTAGLDADAEATLLRGLRALGVAAVVVSHRPAVIAEADRVVQIGGAV